VIRLFTLNDSINITVEKYKLTKKGDLEAAAQLVHDPKSIPDSGTQDLIDLMGDDIGGSSNGTSTKASGKQPASLEDDLLGLSFQDTPYGSGGGIALGFGNHQAIPGPPLLSSTLNSSTARAQTPDKVAPNYSSLPSTTSKASSSSMDVFAGLNQFKSPTPKPVAPQPIVQPKQSTVADDDDDEFAAFSSAVPVTSTLPPLKPNETRILSSQLQIVLEFNQRTAMAPDGPIVLRAKFSNGASEPIKDVTFQLAVTKVSVI